jgi:ADP-ribose pyrophosphatase YjhB (NUDIX family)
MIRKRYTYNFSIFVFGKYSSNNNYQLTDLFNGMTVDEKLLISSLNYLALWYRIWLDTPSHTYSIDSASGIRNSMRRMFSNNAIFHTRSQKSHDVLFNKGLDKFNTFISNRKLFNRMLNDSKHQELYWELPKGGRMSGESEIDCAKREFSEETGMTDFSIINKDAIIVKRHSFGCMYISNYYIAETKCTNTPTIDMRNRDQITEISAIEWVNIFDLHRYNADVAKEVVKMSMTLKN